MEKVVRKICLDSDIIIDILNNEASAKDLIVSLDAEFYITSINSFEIWYGRKESEKIFELLNTLKILDFDNDSALNSGDIMRKLKGKGSLLDIRDVFIAAVCITNKVELLTNNKKHFERLKEFGLILTH